MQMQLRMSLTLLRTFPGIQRYRFDEKAQRRSAELLPQYSNYFK